MEHAPQITFRHMPTSAALEEIILKRIEKLNHLKSEIISCHVVVETPHKHHHQGKHFHVRVDIALPGEEIVINRDPPAAGAHEDPKVAVRDAFDAAERQLKEWRR
jgi:ribosome-associated translation inhibitor RaiA